MNTSLIEKMLQESIGLNISSIGKNTLKSAINRRIQFLNLDDLGAYFERLQSSNSEVNNLIDEVTVNETWFFRDQKPFAAMADFAHAWRTKKPLTKLHVLSLPCSTGEEPYSIAITLLEAGWNEYSFHIDAVDVNNKVLNSAKDGVYRPNSFRGSDKDFREKYFRKTENNFVLRNTFKKCVTFRKGNLINFTPAGLVKQYDIIFCRNLLIYLDQKAQKNAIKTLDNLLAPRGLLFLGHAEAGVFAESQFTASMYPKSFSLVRASDFPEISSTHRLPKEPEKNKRQIISEKDAQSEETVLKKPIFVVDEINEAKYFFDKKECEQALSLCEKHLSTHGPTSEAYLLMGAIHFEKGENSEAIQILRKSIYLDPENIDALELLSTIFLKINDTNNNIVTQERIQRVKNRLNKKGSS